MAKKKNKKKKNRPAPATETSPVDPATDPGEPAPPETKAASAAVTGRVRLLLVLVALAGIIAYSNSYQGVFIFDDEHTFDPNEYPDIGKLWPPSVAIMGHKGAPSAARPTVSLSFHLNYLASKMEPFGYHLFNHLVHLFTALFLFGVARRTLFRSPLFREQANLLATAIALLWVVHPINTSAVTYISQRAESMMGLFFLGSFYFGIRAADPDDPRRKRWTAACVFFCFLSVNTKEIGAFIPILLAFWDRAFAQGSWKETFRARGKLYAMLAANWIFIGLMLTTAPKGNTVGFHHAEITAPVYLFTQAVNLVDYLRLMYWPDVLLLDWGWPLVKDFQEAVLHGLFILALLGLTLFALFRAPRLGFLGAMFFVILAPTSSFLPILSEIKAEHRMYLPSITVISLTVLGGYLLLRALGRKLSLNAGSARFVALALLGAVTIGLTAKTMWQNRLYDSVIKMWKYNAEHTNWNRRVWFNLGIQYQNRDDHETAIGYFKEAIRCSYDYCNAIESLGLSLYKLERFDEAFENLSQAVNLEPETVNNYHTLGVLYLKRGRPDLAYATFMKTLQLATESEDIAKGQHNMIQLLVLQEQWDQALAFLSQWTGQPNGHPDHFRHLANVARMNRNENIARQLEDHARKAEFKMRNPQPAPGPPPP